MWSKYGAQGSVDNKSAVFYSVYGLVHKCYKPLPRPTMIHFAVLYMGRQDSTS